MENPLLNPWDSTSSGLPGNLENLLSMIQISEGEEKSRFFSSEYDTFFFFFLNTFL